MHYTTFLEKRIDYDGSQLRSHWIFEMTGRPGNACVSFIGKCDVLPEHMVDLADKRDKCRIYSEEMLHFIVEWFDSDLDRTILWQRLFVSIIADTIRKHKKDVRLERRGNDIYDGDAKINISIATVSPVSCLMHIGVNISSNNTPVRTKGLSDYGISPKAFAADVMKRYEEEAEDVRTARSKVRWVK